MPSENIDQNWREALKICLSISEFTEDEQYRHIISLNVDQAIKTKAIKIINGLDNKDTMLDDEACAVFIGNIENNQDLVGMKIDNYQLVGLIAKGGMSSIYEAIVIDSDIQNHVAIKILSPYMYSEKALELFKREQTILAKLNHPSIISFHHNGFGPDGMNYLVMEYIEKARNVLDYCIEENLNNHSAVKLTKQIADVCTYFHNNLIIHRDIKADNILIDRDGRIKVIDFGIGQYESEEQHEVTKVFTIGNASPEQILGQNITVQSDVFSLGALLLQLLTKKNPLPKISVGNYDPKETKDHVTHLLSQSDIDKDLSNIIKKAMHIDITQRYSNMAIFASDLDKWLHNKPVTASGDGVFYRISKFIQRNKVPVSLLFIMTVTLLLGSSLLYRAESSLQTEKAKKEKSLEIIRSVFKQANPLNARLDESKITAGFDTIKLDHSALLDADPELEFLIFSEMAELYLSNNYHSKAIENMQLAMNKLELLVDEKDIRFIYSKSRLIYMLSHGAQYKSAIKRAHELLGQINKNNPMHAEAHTIAVISIAQSHYILHELDQSKRYLQTAFDIIGNPRNSNAIKDQTKAEVYNLSAVIQRNEGNHEGALEAYKTTIDLLRNNDEGLKDLSTNLTNLGVLKGDLGLYEEAEAHYKEAKAIIEKLDSNHTQIAINNIQYSSLLRMMKRYQESVELLEESLPILTAAKENRQLAWVYLRLTKHALNRNDVTSALKNFENGYTLSKRLYGLNHPDSMRHVNKLIGIMLIQPELFDMKELFKYLDSRIDDNAKKSDSYLEYQILKSLFYKQVLKSHDSLSPITELLYGSTLNNSDEKFAWLSAILNDDEADSILKSFSQLYLQEFNADESAYVKQCSQIEDWGFSHFYVLKKMLVELCIDTGHRLGFQEISHLKQLKQVMNEQVDQNKPFIMGLIESL